ncbi:MAG: DNA translocase FtsK 4TM domain-containing protein [Candidatus Korobacteraceae bacterium]
MKALSRIFTPTKNRRFNELVGFLLLVSALLLFLAVVSYSPLDRSFNTAAAASSVLPARNWIGVVGAYGSDLLLQLLGITSFLLPAFLVFLGMRWMRSRQTEAWQAKAIGCASLLIFLPALLALLPWKWRWQNALPVEGVLGRIFGDGLVQYLNLPGAYLVTVSAIAVALYLSTTFSFGQVRLWFETRCSFVFAAWQRVQDWMEARQRARSQKELQKKRASRPAASAPLSQSQSGSARTNPEEFSAEQFEQQEEAVPEPLFVRPAIEPPSAGARRSGIERAMEEEFSGEAAPAVASRADADIKAHTTMPKLTGSFKLPSSALLHRADEHQVVDEEELKSLATVLVSKCAEFDVHGGVTQINPGPVVTTFEFKPEAGIKYSRITGLCEDLCLAMRAESILIERMAGKSTVGIQVPNRERETIWLREVVESQEFLGSRSKLMLALGKDMNGRITVADLSSMPHLLIAGSTGAGKSVAINAMIMSLLYKSTPDQVRLILVDPKRLELGVYEGVPHLYTPIITEPKLAANALRNAVREMERRLKLLAQKGVRNIDQYNRLFDDVLTPSLFESGEEREGPIPYIVIIIDELADLMLLDGSNVEESITRLAQMARAVGIHLILATQRPSVDVITGLIKANFPARISFRVATKVDSRTILDANGSEALLGRGDMLYLPSGSSRVQRVHAPFVTEKEIAAVVEFWKSQGLAQYQQAFLEVPKDENTGGGEGGEDGSGEHDDLYQDAVRLVLEFGKASTSLLQRRLRIGYGRAAHLIDLMEKDGVVGAADGPRPREILKRPDWLAEVEQSLR